MSERALSDPEPSGAEPVGGAGDAAAVDPVALLEAYLFAAPEPVEERELQLLLGAQLRVADVLAELARVLSGRGIRLERQGRRWALRTAPELAPRLVRLRRPVRRLSKAALETLAVVAWRQPVTRAEIEAIRGVSLSPGTLELLVELGWVAPAGRREAPGRPVEWATTPAFLDAFGLSSLADLPPLEELAAGDLFNPAADH
ncbi:MAG: SMC-Scp complex subunit ScpB [Geminicoccaceae bacterium]|nr:SMC-Scp complex subunit ScpB [Geminicoccaceae bacterium]MDW8124287.1 SMC-Scp complex subunit ScpB [Geminicoccaceae bacterium]